MTPENRSRTTGIQGEAAVDGWLAVAVVFAKKISEFGCEYIDAPVSGKEAAAKNAALFTVVGGPDEIFVRIKPYLELLGQNITLIGVSCDGQIAKVANQTIVALYMETFAALGVRSR